MTYLNNGAEWAVENGYGWDSDLKYLEENGKMDAADSNKVSDKAKKRGIPQLGSLGSGNHFLEIQKMEEIFDEKAAKVFGIERRSDNCDDTFWFQGMWTSDMCRLSQNNG